MSYWKSIEQANDHYGVSKSTLLRWLRKYPTHFVVENREGSRYVNVEQSSLPPGVKVKPGPLPEGYMTVPEAVTFYHVSESTIWKWLDAQHLVRKTIGNRTYVDTRASKPPGKVPDLSWKPHPKFPRYEVCQDGRVRTIANEKIVPPEVCAGYHLYHLYITKKVVVVPAHWLVASLYLPNEAGKPTLRHRNGDKTDNRVENLEWAHPNDPHADKNLSHGAYNYPKETETAIDYRFEVWKEASVPGFRVSDYGRIKNSEGRVMVFRPKIRDETPLTLVLGQKKDIRLVVEREVARAFLDGYTEGSTLRHRNGDPKDNRVTNLEQVA